MNLRRFRWRRAVALVAALGMGAAGCGNSDDDSASDGSATPSDTAGTSAETAGTSEDLDGHLMFSRFNESTHTFLSTHIANADGSEEHELALPGPEGGGRWSHDGAHIAVMTVVEDGRVGTAIIAPDGTVERVLDLPDPTLNLPCVVWSPDDSRLACEGFDPSDPSRTGIYTVSATDGGDLQRLTTSGEGMHDLPGDFSPDGTSFVFQRSTDEEDGPLMLVDVAGGDPVVLLPQAGGGRFAPDGLSILTGSGGSILVVDLDGEIVEEFNEVGAFLFGPVWSPDGDLIAFSRSISSPHADIFVSRPDGSERVQITDTPDNEIVVEWGR